jgi:hypothetical protein
MEKLNDLKTKIPNGNYSETICYVCTLLHYYYYIITLLHMYLDSYFFFWKFKRKAFFLKTTVVRGDLDLDVEARG